MGVHSLEQGEELSSMLREHFKVFVDHVQCALKHGVKYLWHRFGDMTL